MAVDASGNIYIADSYNHTIRKMTPGGVLSTVAGLAGVQGTADGLTANTRFTFPYGVAVDAAGNVYVADTSNHTVRKISPNGFTGTLAGLARTPGSADGVGSSARFTAPVDVCVDSAGNVLVADTSNHTIRKITPDGTVSTLAGQAGVPGIADGVGSAARFNQPWGLALDSAGNLIVVDDANNTIRKLAPDGTVSTIAGVPGVPGSTDGPNATARFNGPTGVAVDGAGNIFVVDNGNYTLRKIAAGGGVSTLAGSVAGLGFADGIGTSSRLMLPEAVTMDGAGNLYVSDSFNHVIRKGGLTGVAVPTSRLFNLSVRANVIAGQRLITGFVVSGEAKPILVRAVGPGLAPFSPGTALAGNPKLEIYDPALNLVDSNDDWGGQAALSIAFGSVGAFPLPPGSQDAAVLRNVGGSQSAHMLATSTGIGLIEAYDAGTGTASRLINVSTLYGVSPGAGALAAGFYIDGTNQKTVLIRGVGPSLASLFGLSGTLADPKIELFNASQQRIAENDNWSLSLTSTFTQVGAFLLTSNSKDAALLISLTPGLYSALLTGADNGSGLGILEIYEVGN